MSFIDEYMFCVKCKKKLKHDVVGRCSYSYSEKIVKIEVSEFEDFIPVYSEEDSEFLDSYESINRQEQEILEKERHYIRYAEILECPTCREIAFRSYTTLDGALLKPINIYPNYQKWHVSFDDDLIQFVPINVLQVYKELINSFNSGYKIAAGALLGTLLETTCDSKGIDGAVLFKKIDGLEVDPYFKEVLHKIRCLRNESVHHAYEGTPNELKSAIGAIKILLIDLYRSDWSAKEIAALNKELEQFKPKIKK